MNPSQREILKQVLSDIDTKIVGNEFFANKDVIDALREIETALRTYLARIK